MSKHLEKSKVRFIHNVAGAPNVDIYINGKSIALQLAYKESTSYLEVNSGKVIITVYVAGTQNNPILRKRGLLRDENIYTMIVAGSISDLSRSLSLLAYKDDLKCPNGGFANLRFIHAAYGAPAVDVYVNDNLVFANVRYKETGTPTYAPTEIGRITSKGFPAPTVITVKAAGSTTVVLGPVDTYPFNGGIYSIIASNWNSSVPSVEAIIINDNKDKCVVLKHNFDIQSYMGKWYQIASIPQFFDSDCVRSTAEYTYLSDKINVYNTCYDANWNPIRSITGSATAPNPCVPAALIVTFPDTPVEQFPNYLIHATNYIDYAIVGSPTLTSFFILSRSPQMCVKEYKNILKYTKRLGYDISRIKYSNGALTDRCSNSCKHQK